VVPRLSIRYDKMLDAWHGGHINSISGFLLLQPHRYEHYSGRTLGESSAMNCGTNNPKGVFLERFCTFSITVNHIDTS